MIKNTALLDRHKDVLPRWMALYYDQPISLSHGEGRTVWDSEGNRYLDFFGGILTTMTGHAVPEVVEAIRDQAGKMLHSSTLYLIESQIELAEMIAAKSGIPNAKVFFTNSGSEANDAALMLATSFPALQPHPGDAPFVSRPLVRDGAGDGQRVVVADAAVAVQRQLCARLLPLPQPVQAPG